jgi:hypothetical protein
VLIVLVWIKALPMPLPARTRVVLTPHDDDAALVPHDDTAALASAPCLCRTTTLLRSRPRQLHPAAATTVLWPRLPRES